MTTLLNTQAAAAFIGIASGTLENWRYQGYGPRFVKSSPSRRGKVLYRVEDLTAWLEANLYSSTSEVGARA